MDRRTFIGSAAGGLLAVPLAARAQQPVVPVFGILLVFSRDAGKTFTDPIHAYMRPFEQLFMLAGVADPLTAAMEIPSPRLRPRAVAAPP